MNAFILLSDCCPNSVEISRNSESYISVQKLRPLVMRKTADGVRHRALSSLNEVEALVGDDIRFARTPRFDRYIITRTSPTLLVA